MKYILIALLATIAASSFSQETKITVIAGNQTLRLFLDSNNENNLLVIHNAEFSANDFLTIKVDNDSAYKDWKRNFSIYDTTNNAIKDFLLMKDETYCLKLNGLKKLLAVGKTYLIYTTAIPKDPQKAMLVRVANKLVCKIKIL